MPNSPDFIPDNQFTADTPTQPVKPASSDFIPDHEFQSDDDKYGTIGQQALGALESVGRGATFGLSDVAAKAMRSGATKLGINPDIAAPAPEALAGRMAANPVESTVGQMVGGVGALGAAPIGAATEAALGGSTAARVAGMGLEGAAFGGGNAVTDYALGDPNLNAQKIISDIGMGAALGGGLGVLSKGAEALIPAATSRLNKAINGLTDKFSSIPEGFSGDWAREFAQGLKGTDPDISIRKMSSTLGDIYSESKQAAKDMYEKTLTSNLKDTLKDMPLESAQERSFKVYSDLEAKINELRSHPDEFSPPQIKQAQQAVSDLQNSLVNAKTSYDIHSSLHDFAKDISTGIKYDKLPTFSQQAVQNELRNMNGSVREFLKDPQVWGEQAANHFSQVSDLYNTHATAIKNFQQDFMKGVMSSNGMKRAIIDPGKVKTFFNNIQDVGQDLRNSSFNSFLNSAKSLSKASENYAGYEAAQGSISSRVNKLADEYHELKSVAKAMTGKTKGVPLTKELGGAWAANALGVPHPVVAGTLGAIEAYKAIKNPYALGSTINNIFNKIKAISSILDKSGNKVTAASKAIFSGSSRGAIESGVVSDKDYDSRVERIKQLTQDPQAMIDHLDESTHALHEAAPNITQGVHSTMMAGLQFLSSKIPQPATNFPLSEDFEPSQAQKDGFNHYYDIVNDPTSILDQVKDGTVNNRQIEALQAVYPHLLQEMRSNVLQFMDSKKGQALDYSTQMALAKFLGQPLDANMTPQALAANQTVYAPPPSPPTPTKTKPRSTLGGLKELNVADRSQTNTQTLEKDES